MIECPFLILFTRQRFQKPLTVRQNFYDKFFARFKYYRYHESARIYRYFTADYARKYLSANLFIAYSDVRRLYHHTIRFNDFRCYHLLYHGFGFWNYCFVHDRSIFRDGKNAIICFEIGKILACISNGYTESVWLASKVWILECFHLSSDSINSEV